MRKRATVLVAMSGGVDSSVAAALLAEQGYEVVGATLKLWCYEEYDPSPRACCSLEAIADARAVALRMGFTHYVLDYERDFRTRVIEPFLAEYLAGRTPYPCAACNAELKFGRLLEQARALGADFLATGHYVRLDRGDDEPSLLRATQRDKDQSYALWAVARENLPSLLFPLGERTKDEVRAHARRLGLSRVAERVESQDLCFVGTRGYAAFVAREAGGDGGTSPGPIVDLAGRSLGKHRGLFRYTVGQRRGLGHLGGEGRLYVASLDAERNQIRIGPERSLYSRVAVIGSLNWLSHDPPRAGRRVAAQVRYRSEPAPAALWPHEPGARAGQPIDLPSGLRLVFDDPQRAITPGQSAVFYDGDRLLGGGTIESILCDDAGSPDPLPATIEPRPAVP